MWLSIMSKITDDPFLAKCDYIDIHGETSAIANVLIRRFLDDSCKLGKDKVIILHGKGTDVLRKTTHDILKKDKRVSKYYYDGFNFGMTVVELKNK